MSLSGKSYADALRQNINSKVSSTQPKKEEPAVSNLKSQEIVTDDGKITIYYNPMIKSDRDEKIIIKNTGVSDFDFNRIKSFLLNNPRICDLAITEIIPININGKDFKIALFEDPNPMGTYFYAAWCSKFVESVRYIGQMDEFPHLI